MRTSPMLSAAVALLLCGCDRPSASPAAHAEPAARTAVAAAAPDTAAATAPGAFAGATVEDDGAARAIRFAAGVVTIQPVRLGGLRPGVGKACGVRIGTEEIATLGVGDAEAYDCAGLVEAGPVGPATGPRRIGLVYDSGSPNADFRAGVILVESADGWMLDPASIGANDDLPATGSLEAMRKAAAAAGL